MRAVMILVVVIAAAGCAGPALEPYCDGEAARCEGGTVICDDALADSYWCIGAIAGRGDLVLLQSDGDPVGTACGDGVPTCPDGFRLRCVPCPDDPDVLSECPVLGSGRSASECGL